MRPPGPGPHKTKAKRGGTDRGLPLCPRAEWEEPPARVRAGGGTGTEWESPAEDIPGRGQSGTPTPTLSLHSVQALRPRRGTTTLSLWGVPGILAPASLPLSPTLHALWFRQLACSSPTPAQPPRTLREVPNLEMVRGSLQGICKASAAPVGSLTVSGPDVPPYSCDD
jgi:hypothetical protein